MSRQKYMTFSFPIKKEIKRICKNSEKTTKTISSISYKIQLIIRARYMASSSPNFVDNLAEGIDKTKCKYGNDNKNVKLNTKIVFAILNIQKLKMIYYYVNVYAVAENIKKSLMNTNVN